MAPTFLAILTHQFPSVFPCGGDCIECESGWFPLIYDLSQSIQKYNDISEEPIYATQIKEKFGTLRFSTSAHDRGIQDAIDSAEHASAYLCEMCGYLGSLRDLPWKKTLCNRCLVNWKHILNIE